MLSLDVDLYYLETLSMQNLTVALGAIKCQRATGNSKKNNHKPSLVDLKLFLQLYVLFVIENSENVQVLSQERNLLVVQLWSSSLALPWGSPGKNTLSGSVLSRDLQPGMWKPGLQHLWILQYSSHSGKPEDCRYNIA